MNVTEDFIHECRMQQEKALVIAVCETRVLKLKLCPSYLSQKLTHILFVVFVCGFQLGEGGEDAGFTGFWFLIGFLSPVVLSHGMPDPQTSC